MSVNFEKHKADLLAAWKEVVDDKTATDWVLLSYEGLSNDLVIVGKGDGGIEELKEELNSGKIMYAFCRLLDPKTSLHKFVLINWQGEGAPVNRKGSCAGHLREIASFFKGTHVTINARNEEEVDEDEIIEKLSKSTGSSYSFKTRTEPLLPVKEPVGTVYKKVIPRQEINSAERDKFWAAEEEAERKRQAEEARIREEKQRLAELERHRREMSEMSIREAKVPSVENISQEAIRPIVENIAQDTVQPRIQEIENNTESNAVNEIETNAKKSRSEEAQELISTRTVDARAIFENAAKNSSGTQLSNKSATHISNKSASKASLQPSNHSTEDGRLNAGAQESEKAMQNGSAEPQNSSENELDSDKLDTTPEVQPTPDLNGSAAIDTNHSSPVPGQTEGGLRAVALYDYQAADETEISFDPGQVITNIDQIDVGWWQGLGPDGSYGLFPANYVELLE
nr:PREDICTED: drebrin-like protein B [Bemisia tabaci]